MHTFRSAYFVRIVIAMLAFAAVTVACLTLLAYRLSILPILVDSRVVDNPSLLAATPVDNGAIDVVLNADLPFQFSDAAPTRKGNLAIQSLVASDVTAGKQVSYFTIMASGQPQRLIKSRHKTLNPPSIHAGPTTPPYMVPPVIASIINDPTDPATTLGIPFTVADSETPASELSIGATSSNQAVAPNANLQFSGSGATHNLKIIPIGVGYVDITVTVTDGDGNVASMVLNFAASAAFAQPAQYVCHAGVADLSTAVALDSSFMFVADNEDQTIRFYNRSRSGLPLAAFDFTDSLGLTDLTGKGKPREVDIEASTRSDNRIYWLGSHSNSSGGNLRPNRYRIFATDIGGSGASATLTYVGRYEQLRTDLVNWDSSNGHGLGANYFDFAASSADNVEPEALDGFNIEGLTMAPASSTMAYIAFRAPLAPASARTQTVVIPIINFSLLTNGNPSSGPALFGAPILFDLRGLGIRSLECGPGGCAIIAGSVDGAGVFRLYTWSGNPGDAPRLRSAALDRNGIRGSFEGIVEIPAMLNDLSQLQLVADSGKTDWYADNTDAKDLAEENFKKACSMVIAVGPPIVELQLPLISTSLKADNGLGIG